MSDNDNGKVTVVEGRYQKGEYFGVTYSGINGRCPHGRRNRDVGLYDKSSSFQRLFGIESVNCIGNCDILNCKDRVILKLRQQRVWDYINDNWLILCWGELQPKWLIAPERQKKECKMRIVMDCALRMAQQNQPIMKFLDEYETNFNECFILLLSAL